MLVHMSTRSVTHARAQCQETHRFLRENRNKVCLSITEHEKTSYGIIKLKDIVSDYSALFVFILEPLSKCLRHRHIIITYVHCEVTHLSTRALLLNQVISCLVVVCVKAVQ